MTTNGQENEQQQTGEKAEATATATIEEPTFAEYKRFRETGELGEDGKPIPEQKTETTKTQSEAEGDDELEAGSAGESETPEEKQDGTEGKRRKPAAEQRIRELTRKRREAEARANELEEQLQKFTQARENKQAGGKPAETSGDSPPPRPKAEDFESYDELEKALDNWRDQMIDYKLEKRLEAEAARSRAAETTHRLATRWEEQSDAAREKYEDFDEMLAANKTELPQHITQALLDSDCGAELAYHLATHEDELDKIIAASPVKALKTIGVLESQILQPSKPKRRTSNAPPPPDPVGGGKGSPNLENVKDFAEYKKRRMQQRAP